MSFLMASGLYILQLLSSFSSPILSGRRLNVYHTSTHDAALVRTRKPPIEAALVVTYLYSFQFRSAFHASANPSPTPTHRHRHRHRHRHTCGCNNCNDLECRSEMCCTRLVENTGRKNSPSAHHCTICRVI